MASSKIITVLGATGSQGGGLARAILADAATSFTVRAVTRNPDSDKAKALAAAGANVVKADINDVDSLKAAFKDAYGVFAVTNYWEVQTVEGEQQQAKNIAEACKDADVKHVIWSTLEDTRDAIPADFDGMPMLKDVYRVPHLDGKCESNAFFKDVPTTFLITSFFWDNLFNFGLCPKKSEDGKYRMYLPLGDVPLAGHATQDIGKAAKGMFEQSDRFIGETVGIQTDALTISDMCSIMAEEFELPIEYVPIPGDNFRALPFPGADELGNNLQYFRDFPEQCTSLRSKELMNELNPSAQSFADFVKANREAILGAMNAGQ